jgi:nucleotide-binding universal stress UspA family protein
MRSGFRRWAAWLAALSLMIPLAACGEDDETPASGTPRDQERQDRPAAPGVQDDPLRDAGPSELRAPGDIARVLHDLADEYGGELLVVGRHASLLESVLLGSVSTAAVRDERRPVLVVPS